MSRLFFALLLFVIGTSDRLMGGNSPKTVVATRALSAPRIDGRLEESVWQTAVPTEGFEQFDPAEGTPATERTIVRILYDDDALYVGTQCFDQEPSGIQRQLTRRDRSGQADKFTIMLDSYHDHSTAFVFSGTASGVQTDGILSNDGRVYDIQWDAVWDFGSSVTTAGWEAEFRIPFSAIRFAEQDGEYVWGINFRRYIARKKETVEWVMVPRSETPLGVLSIVSKIGHVSGIQNIRPSAHLEVLPYVVPKANFLSQPSPFSRRDEVTGSIGLDAKYGLTNNLTMDVAINPDFGQVEVDAAVLNLSVFETFYPEKRPFFLEGSQLFSFGSTFDNQPFRLFYTRRIGRRPDIPSPDSAGYRFVDFPKTTTILGAAKVTGKTDDGLSVGLLSAITDREKAFAENPTGGRLPSVRVEPRASYNVLRLRKDVLGTSYIGLMATGIYREDLSPVYSSGVDWNSRFGDGRYAVDGLLAGSYAFLPYSSERISGSAGKLSLGKIEGDRLIIFSLYDYSTRNFWIEDLGFYNQPREHGGYSQITLKEDRALGPILRSRLSFDVDYRWNWDGVRTSNRFEIEPVFEFRNFWTLATSYIREFPSFDDVSRGILGLYRRPARNRLIAELHSDVRQPLLIGARAEYQNSTRGLTGVHSSLEVTYRPTTWMELTPAVTVGRMRNEEAWPVYYYTHDGLNLFGDRDVDQHDFSLRGIMTFHRNLTVQFFTQVFIAKGRYSNFKVLETPNELTAYSYPRTPGEAEQGSPDFNEKYLNANVVFRWEYLPGSTLYLVWTQTRYGNSGIFARSLSENFAETFRLPMDNIILAKLSYWWSL